MFARSYLLFFVAFGRFCSADGGFFFFFWQRWVFIGAALEVYWVFLFLLLLVVSSWFWAFGLSLFAASELHTGSVRDFFCVAQWLF